MLTDANFHDEVSRGTVVAIMWIDGCDACVDLKPVMQDVARELPDVRFLPMNTNDNPRVTRELQIHEVPMLVLFKDGVLRGQALAAPMETGDRDEWDNPVTVPVPKEKLIEWVQFRSTYQTPDFKQPLVERPATCEFCMAVRRGLFSLLPQSIRRWLEVRYANVS